nr:MAG TPA: hypothetical protein [Caudoviricetes sp.]
MWYAFPSTIKDASLSDYKYWASDSGRSMTGSMKGTLIGIFPKLQVTIGKQNADERAILCKCLNQTEATVRAYCTERQRFETASFYFGDVTNKIKHWDKHGTLGTLNNGVQPYTCKSTFDSMQFSVISNNRRSKS